MPGTYNNKNCEHINDFRQNKFELTAQFKMNDMKNKTNILNLIDQK